MSNVNKFYDSVNGRLAEKKLGVKSSPNIYAEKHGYLLMKYSICKCKKNE